MLIHYDPDEYKTVCEHHTCEFHKLNPGESYAGCSCSASISSVRRTPEEIIAIKAKRRREEEDRILREAKLIRMHRELRGDDHGE